MENWKSLNSIVELGEYYEISDTGRLRSIDREIINSKGAKRLHYGKIVKPFLDRDGYEIFTFAYKGYKKKYKSHRLVALAFIPNLKGKSEVNHKDGIKNNNNLYNLEWSTPKENTAHAINTGLNVNMGDNSKFAKLKEKDIVNLRIMHEKGEHSCREIAILFNISVNHVYRIVKRQRWKHLA